MSDGSGDHKKIKPLNLDESSIEGSQQSEMNINLQNQAKHFNYIPHDATAAATSAIDPSPLIKFDGSTDNEHRNESGFLASDTNVVSSPDEEQEAIASMALPVSQELNLEASSGESRAFHPIFSTKKYFSDLSSVFSWQFLSWLAIDNFAISGGLFSMLFSLGLPLFKELGIGASRQQLYMTMMLSPWAMKPFIGVASDLFPIRGYNKRYFALYSILIGLAGCASIIAIYPSGGADEAVAKGPRSVQRLSDLIVLCFTAISYEGATLDILGEGKYSELMRCYPETGSSIISFKFAWSLAGSVMTQLYVGPLSDLGYFHILFWISLALSLTPLYPTIRGWIPEKKRSVDEPGIVKLCPGVLFDKGSYRKRQIPFIVITISGLAGPLMAAVTTYADLDIGLAFSALSLMALMIATYFVFPKIVFNIIFSATLVNVSSPILNSAMGYFYTADEECLPGGPNFSYTYYITVTGIVGSIMNFLAVLLYQSFMSTWRFRPVLIFTIVLGALAPIVDVAIVMRWNLIIGISDKLFFLMGNAIFENLIIILQAIPMSAIYAKISPPGMESAVFAYVVGIGNFCNMVSGLLGSAIIQWGGLQTVGDSCDFDNLASMIVLCKILLPMLIGIPAVWLIPNVEQTDQLIDWSEVEWDEDQTEGISATEEDNEENIGSILDSRIEPHLL